MIIGAPIAREELEEPIMYTLIRGGTVVNATGPQPADVPIDGSRSGLALW